MKSATDWLKIQTKEVRDILEAGFTHYHPEEAKQVADDISVALEPEEIENVIDGLCVVACPKAMARLQEEMEKVRARLKKGLPPLPNAPGAGVL
jgi:capsule polysaccharide export protein KpsE/RkpR